VPASRFSLFANRRSGSGAQESSGLARTARRVAAATPKPGHSRNKVIFHLAAIKHIIVGLMANSEDSQTIAREMLPFREASSAAVAEPRTAAGHVRRAGLWSHFLTHEWSSALLYLFLDVVSWLAIYRVAGWFRYDAFYATPFQFFIIELIQLGVIVTALYFVGGYDRTVEKLTLGYTAEHILAVTAAAVVSAMLIYSAATFDQTMKPSRGVLLLSFAIFLPVSLAYRRWIRQYVVASSAGRSFLVIGGGATATRFYEAYSKSSNGQQLEFVDVNEERVGQPIAGQGSPIVQGDLAANVIAESFSLRRRARSARNCSSAWSTRNFRRRAFTRSNPSTKLNGVICRSASSIRFGRSRVVFNWLVLLPTIISSGFSMSLPRR